MRYSEINEQKNTYYEGCAFFLCIEAVSHRRGDFLEEGNVSIYIFSEEVNKVREQPPLRKKGWVTHRVIHRLTHGYSPEASLVRKLRHGLRNYSEPRVV